MSLRPAGRAGLRPRDTRPATRPGHVELEIRHQAAAEPGKPPTGPSDNRPPPRPRQPSPPHPQNPDSLPPPKNTTGPGVQLALYALAPGLIAAVGILAGRTLLLKSGPLGSRRDNPKHAAGQWWIDRGDLPPAHQGGGKRPPLKDNLPKEKTPR